MKKYLRFIILVTILLFLTSCSQDLANIIKKVDSIKIETYRVKGIITKIYFLDTDKIYMYEIKSLKNENDLAILISNNKYRRGDKPEIVVESFRIFEKNLEETKENYWLILKNYILKKTLLQNTEIILLIKKIDIIINQYLSNKDSIVIILESHQNTNQE